MSEKDRAKWARSRVRRKAKWQALVSSLKAVPCADCGGCFPPCVMDFDHVRGKKLFPIGAADSRSLPVLLREIAKCEVVCANCHRIRTWITRREPSWLQT
jgi:hypothetical protein